MNRPGRRRTEELTADLLADMAAPAAAQDPVQAPPPRPAADETVQRQPRPGPAGPALETTVLVLPLGWHAPRMRFEDAGWVAELGPLRVRFRIL